MNNPALYSNQTSPMMGLSKQSEVEMAADLQKCILKLAGKSG